MARPLTIGSSRSGTFGPLMKTKSRAGSDRYMGSITIISPFRPALELEPVPVDRRRLIESIVHRDVGRYAARREQHRTRHAVFNTRQ